MLNNRERAENLFRQAIETNNGRHYLEQALNDAERRGMERAAEISDNAQKDTGIIAKHISNRIRQAAKEQVTEALKEGEKYDI